MGDPAYPLIPPELLQYVLVQDDDQNTGTLAGGQTSDSSSLLHHLTKPGHVHGEGYRRVFIGKHPDDAVGPAVAGSSAGTGSAVNTDNDDDVNNSSDAAATASTSRSFLVGVQTLWQLHGPLDSKPDPKGKGKARQQTRTKNEDARPKLPNGHVSQLQSSKAGKEWEKQAERCPNEAQPRSSGFSDGNTSNGSGDDDSSDDDHHPANAISSSNKRPKNTFRIQSHTSCSTRQTFASAASSNTQAVASTSGQSSRSASQRSGISSSVISSAQGLLNKLSSGDKRKRLSSADSGRKERGALAREKQLRDAANDGAVTPLPQDILSRRATESPGAIGDNDDDPSSKFASARTLSFVSAEGRRPIDKHVSEEVRAKLGQELPLEDEPEHEAAHELLRRNSDTLLPETASDTFVVQTSRKALDVDLRAESAHCSADIDDTIASPTSPQRPSAWKEKPSKTVRWDGFHANGAVPRPKGVDPSLLPVSGSGDEPATDPRNVLSRPDPVDYPVDQTPPSIPPLPQLTRTATSDSAKELFRLAETKEASLPPGTEKVERMLVRVCWTKKPPTADEFDELAARKYTLNWKPWEEMAVVWKKHHLELWSTHHDPFRRYFTHSLSHKYSISLLPEHTKLSVYSKADQLFCLRCPPILKGGRHQSGKAGWRNKRHVATEGTNLFLFRARCSTIAQDWYLGLHLALGKERIEALEVHLSGIGIRIRMPTNADSHDTTATSVAISATRELMTAGLPDRDLVSKEELLQSIRDLIANRADWMELLEHVERRGLHLMLGWRSDSLYEWLALDRSVDGVRRIWDVYAGAVMKQASQSVHRLEAAPGVHHPTTVRLANGVHLAEPPGVEGFVSRLMFRNENQREKLYIATIGRALYIFKASRARPPPFPSTDKAQKDHTNLADRTQKSPYNRQILRDLYREESARMTGMLLRCKGAIRLREINEVELDDSCKACNASISSKAVQAGKNSSHEHLIVQLTLADGKKFRFETTPKEAAREWSGRLKGLMDYWKKREQADANMQLSLSANATHRPITTHACDERAPFERRFYEDSTTQTDVSNPLIPQMFNLCMQAGCMYGVHLAGRLYFKRGHREAVFWDRFIVLADHHIVIFETFRRNYQKRPVPLLYHRRVKTLQLRDAYIVTGEACSQYFRQDGHTGFDPSSDQNSLARVYKEGLIATDDPIDCTFMLWKQKASGTVANLGKGGKAYLFRARSRLERDQWVQAINITRESYSRSTREREVKLATFSQVK